MTSTELGKLEGCPHVQLFKESSSLPILKQCLCPDLLSITSCPFQNSLQSECTTCFVKLKWVKPNAISALHIQKSGCLSWSLKCTHAGVPLRRLWAKHWVHGKALCQEATLFCLLLYHYSVANQNLEYLNFSSF